MRNALTPIFLFHIGLATIALISGAAALIFRKGTGPHRAAGKVFVVSMLCMSVTGIYLALIKPAMISVVAGAFTFYLVATALMTVKRKKGETGRFEIAASALALAIAAGSLTLGFSIASSELGTDQYGIPATVYYFFGTMATLCAALDIRLIYQRGVTGVHRVARHLWRMCFTLLLAANTFFIGNPHVFPEPIRKIEILATPVVAVLALMLFWLIRVSFTNAYRKPE